MDYIHIVLTVGLIAIFWIVYQILSEHYDLTESYIIGQRLIQDLVDTFIKAKVIPYASIPNNELHPDELERFRNECAKYVLHMITNCSAYKKLNHIYTPELIVCFVDKYFTEQVVKIKGVRL